MSGGFLSPFTDDAMADHRLPIEPLEKEVLKFLARQEAEANGSSHGTFIGISRLEAISGVPARRINGMLRRESGDHVSLHVADRIAAALGLPLELVYA